MSKLEEQNFVISADYILELGQKLKKLEAENRELGIINKLLIEHIGVLDKRSKKFSDKFKMGRFKFKTFDEKLNSKRIVLSGAGRFVLNDD